MVESLDLLPVKSLKITQLICVGLMPLLPCTHKMKQLVCGFIAATTICRASRSLVDSLQGNFAIGMTNLGAIALLCAELLSPVVFSLANPADFLLGRKDFAVYRRVIRKSHQKLYF